ncbi:MAG: alanine racemase [Tissierellia bacterium]|nr:alanine racemase [Tissierellia bacterium]
MSNTNRLIVDSKKVNRNIEILKSKCPNSEFFAVIKADAYGMGAVEFVRHMDPIVSGYCVANIEEAIELRKSGTKKDILVLGYIHPEDISIAYENNIMLTIYDIDMAKKINSVLEGGKIRVHIKIDTGHGRIGFSTTHEDLKNIKSIFELQNLQVDGVFSHFATADEEDDSYTLIQKSKFDYVIDKLGNLTDGMRIHLSNDAGIIKHGFCYNMVRSGISLHGVYPSEYVEKSCNIGLEPTFEWKTKISKIKFLEKGESISYGRTFICDKRMKIATLAIGYADGYKRGLSNIGYVLIKGKKARILGNITMDQMMVDVTGIDVEANDDVTLIGSSEGEYIDVNQVAKWANTISYEILTSISKRVKREWI